MKLAAFILLIATPFASIAQESPSTNIPDPYAEFQGEWVVVSQSGTPDRQETQPEIFVTITGKQITLSGSGVSKDLQEPLEFRVPKTQAENPYRELRKRGAKKLDKIVDVEYQIVVFWCVGIYKFKGEELHLALKYCGQGLEGQNFRDFRPPSSFDDEQMEDECRIVLRRKKS